MYTIILLILLLRTTIAEALNKTNNECIFNESSRITAKELLYCRYIRKDWDSSDISISELNFYYELQFKLEKSKQKIFYDNFYDVCRSFNITSFIYNIMVLGIFLSKVGLLWYNFQETSFKN